MIDYNILMFEKLVTYLEKYYHGFNSRWFRKIFDARDVGELLNSKNITFSNNDFFINEERCTIGYTKGKIIISSESIKIFIKTAGHIEEYNKNGLVVSFKNNYSLCYTNEEVAIINENEKYLKAITPVEIEYDSTKSLTENHNAACEYFNELNLTR